jgi:hypothetical protein
MAAERMEPTRTFGSPPVLAVDGWEMRKREGSVMGSGAELLSRSGSVANTAARGLEWRGGVVGLGVGAGEFGARGRACQKSLATS